MPEDTLPNVTRLQFWESINPLLRRMGITADIEAQPINVQDAVLRVLATDLFMREENHPLLRVYLNANCFVRFQGE